MLVMPSTSASSSYPEANLHDLTSRFSDSPTDEIVRDDSHGSVRCSFSCDARPALPGPAEFLADE
jgi:hypothetical protein